MNPRPDIASYPVCIEDSGGNGGKLGKFKTQQKKIQNSNCEKNSNFEREKTVIKLKKFKKKKT